MRMQIANDIPSFTCTWKNKYIIIRASKAWLEILHPQQIHAYIKQGQFYSSYLKLYYKVIGYNELYLQ